MSDVVAALLLSIPLLDMCIGEAIGRGGINKPIIWITFAFYVLYSTVEVFTSRSPGKWLCGMQIVDRSGKSTLRQRVVRWLVKFLPGYAFFIGMHLPNIGFFMLTFCLPAYSYMHIVFSSRRVGVHDLCAGTEVVRIRKAKGFQVIQLPSSRREAA